MKSHLKRVCLAVTGLELFGHHGATRGEQAEGNRFRIDLEFEGGFEKALDSDHLEDTVDYSQAVQAVSETNRANHYFLIESFADAIADDLLTRFPEVKRISVRVAKLDPPGLEEKVACTAINLTKERA